MMKSAKAIKPMFSRVNNYARNNSPQQISNFDLVSLVKVGQPSQKWSNSKVKILEVEIGELLSRFKGAFTAVLKLE